MAARTKQYDKNRFKKVYPRFRAEPRPGLMVQGDGDVVLESVIVNFDNQDLKDVILVGPYSNMPSVTATPLGDINNVNVFITSLELQSVPSGAGRKVSLRLEAAASITGKVHVQAILA